MSDKKKSEDKQFTVTPKGQVVNAAGVLVTNNPIGAGRKWIKLWVDPWLDGTTRYMNTGSERAFWVDLLAEAGRSRFPGYVCPGIEHGELIGYPLPWYQSKQPDLDIFPTLEKFASQAKIAYTITCRNPICVVVQILNWDKYQSPIDDATRARMSRDRKKKKPLTSTSRQNVTESHDETSHSDRTREEKIREDKRREEAEAEENALRAKVAAAAAVIEHAFQFLEYGEPFGSLLFQLEWANTVQQAEANRELTEECRYDMMPTLIERCIQNCQRKDIPILRTLYDEKRKAEYSLADAIQARMRR